MDQYCTLKAVPSGKLTEAVVYEFKQNSSITLVVNKAVKIKMSYNGRTYEGRMAGLDFETDGKVYYKK
jgi:hypothetical protein